ncbi:dihydroorotate dehydrogenase-like protein [candidate division KSB1 bacterium]
MADLSTDFMGIPLKNPIIVASSGLTDSVDKIVEIEQHGAGAVVLKSIFEEEITMEHEKILKEEATSRYKDEYLDYFDYRIKEDNISQYYDLISQAKKKVSIPVFASINCKSSHEWTYFAKNFEKAGTDGLELNVFLMPSNLNRTNEENEQIYFKIVKKVSESISIPISIKISYYFSNLGLMIQRLSETKIKGMVLFNRFYSPDIDVDNLKVTSTNVFSSPHELSFPLRWIALMAKRVSCDLAASTGIHDGISVVKQLLAGAQATQIASALYLNGPAYIKTMLEDIESWMKEKNYNKISDFRGILSQPETDDPSLYERVQFMKYFSDRENH